MAFSKTDTRQRAYNRIDACSPQGNWVDERSYNKTRPGCLMGNWYEEAVLSDSAGQDSFVYTVESRPNGTVRGKGGFQSTKFLVNPDPTAQPDPLTTTARSSYTEESADVRKFRPERLGPRRQRTADALLAKAVDEMPQPQPQRTEYTTSYAATIARTKSSSVPLGRSLRLGASASGAIEAAEVTAEGPVDALDYADDQPVTLYTGNPRTGNKMTVQGTTAGTGKSSFARNCNFSTPIDRHPIGGKHKTPQF